MVSVSYLNDSYIELRSNDTDYYSLGGALDCFSCESHISWTDCTRNQKKGTCATDLDKCAKLYARGNGEVFVRGCDTSEECANQRTCKSLKLNECSLDCCDENLCNAGVIQMTGDLVLLICIITTLYTVVAEQLSGIG